MPRRIVRSPRTKAEVLDRMLSFTFTGDLRSLAPDPEKAKVKRTRPNAIALEFADTQANFELVVRKPRAAGMLGHSDDDGEDEENGESRTGNKKVSTAQAKKAGLRTRKRRK